MWITKMISCPLPGYLGLESKTDTREEHREPTLAALRKIGKEGSKPTSDAAQHRLDHGFNERLGRPRPDLDDRAFAAAQLHPSGHSLRVRNTRVILGWLPGAGFVISGLFSEPVKDCLQAIFLWMACQGHRPIGGPRQRSI